MFQLSDAQQGAQAGRGGSAYLGCHHMVVFTEVCTSFGMPQLHDLHPELCKHPGTDLTGDGTLGDRTVLCGQLAPCTAQYPRR
ncbi:hypothetical protein D3C74_394830 [compost metagenome]